MSLGSPNKDRFDMSHRPIVMLGLGGAALLLSSLVVTPVQASGVAVVKLTPNEALTPGQVISVSGSGFRIKSRLILRECPIPFAGVSSCIAEYAAGHTTHEGYLFPAVNFTVMNITTGPSKCGTNNPDRNRCAIYAFTAPGPAASAVVHFAKTS